MAVPDLIDGQRDGRHARDFPENDAVAPMNRYAALEVGQAEVHPPVAAVGGAEQREQRLILVDRQQLAVAKRPSLRGEVEGHDLDLAYERIAHDRLLLEFSPVEVRGAHKRRAGLSVT